MEDRRERRVPFDERMLGNLEHSEDLKVGISELKEQLETLEQTGFSIMQTAQEARNEKGQKIFEISPAELERRCQGMMQEVKLLSERQEVQKGVGEEKIWPQSRATEKHDEQITEETRESEEKKAKETLLFVQKNTL